MLAGKQLDSYNNTTQPCERFNTRREHVYTRIEVSPVVFSQGIMKVEGRRHWNKGLVMLRIKYKSLSKKLSIARRKTNKFLLKGNALMMAYFLFLLDYYKIYLRPALST